MTEEIIIAGFGGQGVMSMGKILAYAGLIENLEVSWMPSYGPEMRGGTANVIVILSDEKISSPILSKFDTAIILNQQSLDKFENSVKSGGILIFDYNGINRMPQREDIDIYGIHALEEAVKMNLSKIFNMFVLGGYLKIKPIVKFESVEEALKKVLPKRNHSLIPMNLEALKRGYEIVEPIKQYKGIK